MANMANMATMILCQSCVMFKPRNEALLAGVNDDNEQFWLCAECKNTHAVCMKCWSAFDIKPADAQKIDDMAVVLCKSCTVDHVWSLMAKM